MHQIKTLEQSVMNLEKNEVSVDGHSGKRKVFTSSDFNSRVGKEISREVWRRVQK